MSIGPRPTSVNEIEALRRKVRKTGFITQHVLDDNPDIEDTKNRDTVEVFTDDHTLDEDDYGKTLVMNSAADKTFTLPAVTASEVGLYVVLVKRGAGKLTIQAGGTDKINDSGAGGTLYNDLAEETFATVRLKVIAAATWLIEHFTGSGWRTS